MERWKCGIRMYNFGVAIYRVIYRISNFWNNKMYNLWGWVRCLCLEIVVIWFNLYILKFNEFFKI